MNRDVNVTVRIRPDVLEKIDGMIEGREITRSDFIRRAISSYMQEVRA